VSEAKQLSVLEKFMTAAPRHGDQHFQIVVRGEYGAIEFHFTVPREWRPLMYDATSKPFFSLGVEFHKRVSAGESNREACALLGNDPCYHDGTSLWASEYVMPAFLAGGADSVYAILERRYREWAE
jgi:hypothetical protein